MAALTTKPYNLRPVSRTQEVEGENRVQQTVLYPPHVLHGIWYGVSAHMHTHTLKVKTLLS